MAFSFMPFEEQTYLQGGIKCNNHNLPYATWGCGQSPFNVDEELLDYTSLVSTLCVLSYMLRADHCLLPPPPCVRQDAALPSPEIMTN